MRRPQHLRIRVEPRDRKKRGDDESSDEETGVASPDSPDSPSPAAKTTPAVAPAATAPPAAIVPPVVIAPPAAAPPPGLINTVPSLVSPPTITLPAVAAAAGKPDSPSPTTTSFPAIVNVGEPPDSPSPTTPSFPGVTKTEKPDTPSPTTTSFPAIVNAGESSSASLIQTEASSPASVSQSTSSILPPAPVTSSAPPPQVTTAPPDPLPARPSSGVGVVSTTRVRGSTQLSSSSVKTGLAPSQQTGGPGRTQSNAGGLGPDPQLAGAPPGLAASAPDSTGTKVGIAFGVIAGVAMLATILFLLWKRKMRGRASDKGNSATDGQWRSRDSAASSGGKSSIFWGGARFTRSTRAATEPRSQSKILDELISAAYAAEDGNAQGGGRNSFVMPHGFVADEKSQAVPREDFLPNERSPQASIRKSLASWIRGRHPLDLNPLKRKSTATVSSSPSSVAEIQATMADLPPVPAIQSRWSESTRPSAGRNTRPPQDSLYDLYARTPSGMTWVMDQSAPGYRTEGSDGDIPTRAQSMMSEAIIPPTPQSQIPPSVPAPDPTAAWVESQTRMGRGS